MGTKEDIEKMVQDAEKFKAEDDAMKAKVEAKNGLESYCHQIKNTLNEEQLKDKFTDDDKKVIEDITYEGKRKEIEAKYNPIMQRVYQAAGGGAGGMPGMGGMPGGGMPGGAGAPGGSPTGGNEGVDDLD